MERLQRLLRLARLRGDKAAIAILEGQRARIVGRPIPTVVSWDETHVWSETELRAAWGDR